MTQKHSSQYMSEKTLPIILTKEEWSSVNMWVESGFDEGNQRISKEWFTELSHIIKPFYMKLFFSDDYSAVNIPYDSIHVLELERNYFRILILSIGRVCYSQDVKTITSKIAYDILMKLESQGDEKWKEYRF